MCPQRIQDLPDDLVFLVVVQRLLRLDTRRHANRQDDVAHFLAFGAAHDASHGLHHVDLGLARMQEQDRVERRYVHTLRKAARIRQNAAGAILAGRGLQPGDGFLASSVAESAVHMTQFTGEVGNRLRHVRCQRATPVGDNAGKFRLH